MQLATSATQIAAGDIDGDGTDDLAGIWPGQGGVWVKYGSDSTWEKLSSSADWIACGKMRGGGTNGAGVLELASPIGGFAAGPGTLLEYEDWSEMGPGGVKFVYQEDPDLVPHTKSLTLMANPGPDEPGFRCVVLENLVPGERLRKREQKIRK